MAQNSSNGGVSLCTLLGLLFLGLKLGGCINWPWIWVLCPFWIPLAFGIFVLMILLFTYTVADEKIKMGIKKLWNNGNADKEEIRKRIKKLENEN